MNIHTITYTPYLDTIETRSISINLDRVVAIVGPHTTWRNGSKGYQFYSVLYIHADVHDLTFTITVEDSEFFSSQEFDNVARSISDARYIPKCEAYLRTMIANLMEQWNATSN